MSVRCAALVALVVAAGCGRRSRSDAGGFDRPDELAPITDAEPGKQLRGIRPADQVLMAGFWLQHQVQLRDTVAEVNRAAPNDKSARMLAIMDRMLDDVEAIAPGLPVRTRARMESLADYQWMVSGLSQRQGTAINQRIKDYTVELARAFDVPPAEPRDIAVARVDERGDRATIYIVAKDVDGELGFEVVRERGRWYADFASWVDQMLRLRQIARDLKRERATRPPSE